MSAVLFMQVSSRVSDLTRSLFIQKRKVLIDESRHPTQRAGFLPRNIHGSREHSVTSCEPLGRTILCHLETLGPSNTPSWVLTIYGYARFHGISVRSYGTLPYLRPASLKPQDSSAFQTTRSQDAKPSCPVDSERHASLLPFPLFIN